MPSAIIDNRNKKRVDAINEQLVNTVKDRFVKDVVNRYLEQRHSRSLNIDQRYLKDELQKIYQSTENEPIHLIINRRMRTFPK